MTGSNLLSLLAVICLCFTLCSCGKKDKNETDNTSPLQSSAVGGNSTEADNDLTAGASEGSSQQTAGSSDKSGSSAEQGSSANKGSSSNKGNSSSRTTGSGSSVNFGGQDDGVIDYDDSGSSSSDKNTGNGSSQGGSSSGSSSDSGSSSNSSLDFNNPSNWDIREFDWFLINLLQFNLVL